MRLSKRTLIDLWMFLIIASVLDIIFTYELLNFDNMVKEANFMVRAAISYGPKQILITKMAPLLALGAIIFMNGRLPHYRKWFLDVGIIVAALILLIVLLLHVYFYLYLSFSILN